MARNGAGVYSLVSGNPVVTGTTISSTTMNNTLTDIASALSQSVSQDGQTTITANQAMGGFRHTGIGNGVNRNDYPAIGQIQDGSFIYVGTVGGTADVITLTPSPAITSYAAGQTFRFIASGANTTNVTVNISGVGAKAVTKNGTTALIANDIASGTLIETTYDGTQFQLKNLYSVSDSLLVHLAGTETISGAKTFTSPVITQSTQPQDVLIETDAATDNKRWHMEANGGVFSLKAVNDANAVATDFLTITRSGTTITDVKVPSLTLGAPTGGNKGAGTGNAASGWFDNGNRVHSANSVSSPALQTPVANTTLTFAHGLTVVPSLYTAMLVAGSAPEHGFTAGQEVRFLNSSVNVESDPLSADATNIYVEVGGFSISSRTTHLTVVPTLNDATKWQVKVRAWV